MNESCAMISGLTSSGPTTDAHPSGGATENISDVPAPMQGPFRTFTATITTRSNGFDQAPDLEGGEAMTSSSGPLISPSLNMNSHPEVSNGNAHVMNGSTAENPVTPSEDNWLRLRDDATAEIEMVLRHMVRDGETSSAGEVAYQLWEIIEAPRGTTVADRCYFQAAIQARDLCARYSLRHRPREGAELDEEAQELVRSGHLSGCRCSDERNPANLSQMLRCYQIVH